MKHLRYLNYVIRHKWFVFLACCRLGIWWRGILHDWSKLTPWEWFAYIDHFYGRKRGTQRDSTGYYKPTDTGDPEFDVAWLHHANCNPHHWQYWTQMVDEGTGKVFEMPVICVLEMVADWMGASRAQGATSSVVEWYEKNGDRMILAGTTREMVESILTDESTQ